MKKLILRSMGVLLAAGIAWSVALYAADSPSSIPADMGEQSAFADLERQCYEGSVSEDTVRSLMPGFLARMAQRFTEGSGASTAETTPKPSEAGVVFPLAQPKQDQAPQVTGVGTATGLSLAKGQAAYRQRHAEVAIPVAGASLIWRKSLKSLRVVAPEDGVIVRAEIPRIPRNDPRGKVVGLYNPASGRLWMLYPFIIVAVTEGKQVKAGAMLGQSGSSAPLKGSAANAVLNVHLFNVTPTDVLAADPLPLLKSAYTVEHDGEGDPSMKTTAAPKP